ncbi:MAG: NAD-dependent epimerase/dehydratase family protein, partial [Odoribacter splanchnicus]
MVFVTGATGLLGSHLLYFLAVSGHSVSALRRKQSRLEDARAVFLQYPDGEKYWNTI